MANEPVRTILGGGSKGGYLDSVLFFKADQKYTVRIFDPSNAVEIWKHNCRTSDGKYVKVLCINDFNDRTKCPLCNVNNKEKYAGFKPKDKPYPKSSEYAKAVWVYEDSAVKLMVGNEIWRNIDVIYSSGCDVHDKDISVVRKDGNRVTYTVVPLAPSEFKVKIDESAIPKVADYLEYLTKNISRIDLVGGPPANPSAEKETTSVSSDTTGAKPSMLGGAPAAPVAASGSREDLMGRFRKAINKSFNSSLVSRCMASINEARKVTGQAVANDMENLSDSELKQFVDQYEKETQ
jgi:hypothetical protein